MTIFAYIDAQPEDTRGALYAVYGTIARALPEAETCISWQMPTFRKGRNLIHFAAAKRHVGIYPGPEAVEAFREELDAKGIPYSKGAIRFSYARTDLDLISRIAVWCGQNNA